MERRHILALVAIWVVVFVGAFAAAVAFEDDNPSTDDGAAFGAIAALVGAALSGVYLMVMERRSARKRPRRKLPRSTSREGTVASLKRSWREVTLALGLWVIGTAVAFGVGLPMEYAVWLGGCLPLAVLLLLHVHRA